MDVKDLNNGMARWYNIASVVALIALVICYHWRLTSYMYTDAAMLPCIIVLALNTAMVLYRYSF